VDTKKTILIVDDSEFVRSYHSYILEQADFQVITAVDGSDGLEKLYTNSCDLVLSDINMSNMDGYEFIRRCVPIRSTVSSHHHRVHGERSKGQDEGI
jgi:CheY-like chemotaxis protein